MVSCLGNHIGLPARGVVIFYELFEALFAVFSCELRIEVLALVVACWAVSCRCEPRDMVTSSSLWPYVTSLPHRYVHFLHPTERLLSICNHAISNALPPVGAQLRSAILLPTAPFFMV